MSMDHQWHSLTQNPVPVVILSASTKEVKWSE